MFQRDRTDTSAGALELGEDEPSRRRETDAAGWKRLADARIMLTHTTHPSVWDRRCGTVGCDGTHTENVTHTHT